MRMFSKNASAKELTDGERYSCSATLPRWSFSVIIVFDLLIFEGWELGSFETHDVQGSGIFSRFFFLFALEKAFFIKWMWCFSFLVPWHFANNLIGKNRRAAKKVSDVLRYRILKKTAFDFFGNVVSVVLYCVQLFWWFSHKPSKNIDRFHRKQNTKFPKNVEYVPKMSFWALLCFFLWL